MNLIQTNGFDLKDSQRRENQGKTTKNDLRAARRVQKTGKYVSSQSQKSTRKTQRKIKKYFHSF
jgi:hypothetical protein